MDNIENSQYLTIAEVALKLKLSEMTVRRLIKRGELKATKFGRSWRIKESDINNK